MDARHAPAVVLLVLSASGCGSDRNPASPDTITPRPVLNPVIAVSTPGSVTPLANLTAVTFDGSESSASNATITSYSWSFAAGDAPVTGAVVTRQFDAGGTYTASLTVAGGGVTATARREVTIASLTGTWTSVILRQTRTFTLLQSGSLHGGRVSLTGNYADSSLAGQAFHVEGTLGGEPGRAIQLAAQNLDDPAVFVITGSVSADALTFSGLVTAGSAAGETLVFARMR